MARPSLKPETRSRAARTAAADSRNERPFFGLIDVVLVGSDTEFPFEGAVNRDDASAIWRWMRRDLGADVIDAGASETDPGAAEALEALLPDLLKRAKDMLAAAATSREIEQRLKTQLMGEAAYVSLPKVLLALKCRAALEKAQVFGRAANGIHDEAALAAALQSMPLQERSITALLMQGAVGHVANPGRLMAAAIRLAGGPSEDAINRSGFGPLVDAFLSHAQNQIPVLSQAGAFADMDLICRAIDRFHRLMRAVNYVELGRTGRWSKTAGGLTKAISERLEPRLHEVAIDVNLSMRKARDGADRVDATQLLAALNGVYLLATVRECRDSLALNALFEQVWTQVGQTLEVHVQRNLEALRQDPADAAAAKRLDAGIKMAEQRYGTEYADILRRAREAVDRRAEQS